MKYLILIALIFLVFRLLFRGQSPRRGSTKAGEREAERMVCCAHCGVNQPVSESILHNGSYYCCQAHLLAAESPED